MMGWFRFVWIIIIYYYQNSATGVGARNNLVLPSPTISLLVHEYLRENVHTFGLVIICSDHIQIQKIVYGAAMNQRRDRSYVGIICS